MSSPDTRTHRRELLRGAAGLAATAALAMTLAGCFRPLYGPSASGVPVQDILASIAVDPVDDRIGHYLVEELRFNFLNGLERPANPKYTLSMDVTEKVSSAIVSSETGRASNATVTVNVNYTLKKYGTDQQVLTGIAVGSASYDRSVQRFASVRAARDAEIRVARLLADQIRTRLAADLAYRT
jgi:LPS-assembly lipoprotein